MKIQNSLNLIKPNWPAPPNVRALQSTRQGGLSHAPYNGLNLGDHVNDVPLNVAKNRQLLSQYLPSEPLWLKQTHGIMVANHTVSCAPQADASISFERGEVCVVMTADCLPVLLCDTNGTVVAAVHAGWRGLCDGVIEAAVKAMNVPANTLMAWLGPAIGPQSFEVGAEVHATFVEKDSQAGVAFKTKGEKYLADIYQLARMRLNKLGISQIYGGEYCTVINEELFFSYRRDGVTGRMGAFIWLE